MKNQRLVVFTICLLSGAFAGCHEPAKSVIELSDNHPKYPGVPGIYAEEGGTIQFRSESTKYPYFKITITDDNGVCKEGDALYGSVGTPATCHVMKTSQFTFWTDESTSRQALDHLPSPRHNGPFTGYTKPCPPVCK